MQGRHEGHVICLGPEHAGIPSCCRALNILQCTQQPRPQIYLAIWMNATCLAGESHSIVTEHIGIASCCGALNILQNT